MTLLFADGFEDGSLGWTFGGIGTALGAGRFGNGLVTGGSSAYATTGFPPTTAVMTAGVAFRPVASSGFMAFYDGALANISLARGAGGEVIAHTGVTVLGSSASGVLPAGAWSYVELRATVHQTTGIVVVRVNGVEVINLANQDTQSSSVVSHTALRLGNNAAQGAVTGDAFDDVYICNGLGSYNTTFLGDLTVEHLRPGADDTVQFVGSDGNSVDNFQLVDEAGAYNGADYVASSTVGQRDLYTPVASARAGSSGVFGVLVERGGPQDRRRGPHGADVRQGGRGRLGAPVRRARPAHLLRRGERHLRAQGRRDDVHGGRRQRPAHGHGRDDLTCP